MVNDLWTLGRGYNRTRKKNIAIGILSKFKKQTKWKYFSLCHNVCVCVCVFTHHWQPKVELSEKLVHKYIPRNRNRQSNNGRISRTETVPIESFSIWSGLNAKSIMVRIWTEKNAIPDRNFGQMRINFPVSMV